MGLCPYIGGKENHADWIISHFPTNYPKMTYVEVFGGMASVLLEKKPSKIEIYNDINRDLTNLFLVVKENPDEFLQRLSNLPYSEHVYTQFLREYYNGHHHTLDCIEQAARYFYLQYNSFSGRFGGSFSISLARNAATAYSRRLNTIPSIAERIKNVQIMNKDWRWVLDRWYDRENTLFYCDPPYFATEEYYYNNSFCGEDHKELAEKLKKIKGTVFLSYYYFDGLYELYPGWVIHKKNTFKPSVYLPGITQKPKATELLLCNKKIQSVLDASA